MLHEKGNLGVFHVLHELRAVGLFVRLLNLLRLEQVQLVLLIGKVTYDLLALHFLLHVVLYLPLELQVEGFEFCGILL